MTIQMIDGTEPKRGQTVVTDHIVQTYQISIRSLQGIMGTKVLKDLLQQKFEVTEIKQIDEISYCRKP